jgi:hypothetical protein
VDLRASRHPQSRLLCRAQGVRGLYKVALEVDPRRVGRVLHSRQAADLQAAYHRAGVRDVWIGVYRPHVARHAVRSGLALQRVPIGQILEMLGQYFLGGQLERR